MNFRMIAYILGKLMKLAALLMLCPLLVSLFYGENEFLAFLIPAFLLAVCGFAITSHRPKNTKIYAKEGFVIVAAAWILLSVFGAIPFVISGAIPSYVDAFFETVSGFTTTGASILTEVESLPYGILFWRSFTHWIGGMGVLVFMLALLPKSETNSMHIMRAEVPGPKVGKLVSKINLTARILYGIYIGITALEIVLLLMGGMPLFDSVVNAFSTAGTGGFAIKNTSIAAYNSVYVEYVIGIFMLLFGINFNLFYFILIKKFSAVVKNEEFRAYLLIVISSVVLIAINIYSIYGSVREAIRYSFFQVSSIITTTGFATADYTQWPMFSQCILVLLTFFGACAGSTGGGIKISRIVILVKQAFKDIRRMMRPRSIESVKFEGKALESSVSGGVKTFFIAYCIVIAASILLLSLNGFDFTTTSTAVITCINNVGPGLGIVGPAGNFSAFAPLSKLLLSFDMLAGRLEIFPMLILFAPSVWRRK